MNKQEEMQKYLEDILADAWRKGTRGRGIDVSEEADRALLHLTKKAIERAEEAREQRVEMCGKCRTNNEMPRYLMPPIYCVYCGAKWKPKGEYYES